MTQTPPKEKRQRLAVNNEFLNKLISFLENERLTKEQLAEKLGLESAKKITDSVLLQSIRLSGNSKFLENLIEKKGRKIRKTQTQYSTKKGLVVPAWLLEGKGIVDGQKYEMTFGSRKGIITLHPMEDGTAE